MQKELNILYTVDDSFLNELGVSLASLIKNNKDYKLNIYIATDKDENTDNFKRLKNFYNDINIIYLNCREYDETFKKLNLNKWGSNTYYLYWRYIAVNKINVDKLIYLDADILCLNKIEFPNLNNKATGCVVDSVHPFYNKLLNLDKDFCFFNTGTIFFDVKKWKENKCLDKMIALMKEDKPFIMADQDYYSYALQEDIEILDPKYNYFVGYDYYGINNSIKMYELDNKKFYSVDELVKASRDVVFYHCLDGVFGRPWSEGNFSPVKEKYEYYRSISPFPEFKNKFTLSEIMKVEHTLEFLPKPIYNKIHSLAIKTYIKKEIKKYEEKTK